MTSATPRFEALVPYASPTVTANFGGSDQSPSLASGYYYHLGNHGRAVSIGNASNLFSTGGHALRAGARVTIWDISTDSAIGTGITVLAAAGNILALDDTYTWAIGDRIFEASDWLGYLEARLASADTANGSDNVRVSMSTTTGIVSLAMASGTATVTLDATSAERLRVSSSAISLSTTPVAGDRCHLGGLYPTKPSTDERQSSMRERQVYESDDDTVRVLSVAAKRRLSVRVRYVGTPRASSWDTLHDVEDFVDHAGQGYPVRYYPDRTVYDAYDREDAPWGYETWVLLDPTEFDPEEVVRGSYDLWETTLRLQAMGVVSYGDLSGPAPALAAPIVFDPTWLEVAESTGTVEALWASRSGSTLIDETGNHNGTLTGVYGDGLSLAAGVGASVDLSGGSTSYATVGDTADFAFFHQTWTGSVELWFRLDVLPSSSQGMFLFATGVGSTNKGIAIFVYNNGGTAELRATLSNGNGAQQVILTATGIAATTIYHCVLTMDGSVARLDLDGATVVTDTAVSPTATGNSTHTPKIGRDDVFGWSLNGQICPVVVRSTHLTAEQVADLYDAGAGS